MAYKIILRKKREKEGQSLTHFSPPSYHPLGQSVNQSTHIHTHRFTDEVSKIVRRGGRCLLPVFALGRAQELMLILDEYWHANKDLHKVGR